MFFCHSLHNISLLLKNNTKSRRQARPGLFRAGLGPALGWARATKGQKDTNDNLLVKSTLRYYCIYQSNSCCRVLSFDNSMSKFVFDNRANGTCRFQKILYTFEWLLFKRRTNSIIYAEIHYSLLFRESLKSCVLTNQPW